MSQQYDERLERETGRLKDAAEAGDITHDDYEAIKKLKDHLDARREPSTTYNYVQKCRLMAQRMEIPLTDATLGELDDALDAMGNGSHPAVKDDGIVIHTYQTALRVFFKYHDLGIDHEEIDIDPSGGRDLEPTDLLTNDDVDRLLQASVSNPRDRAFIALALATGQRIDALRTLKIEHIERNGPTMDIRLNTEEGALKGASGAKPVLWAKHYLKPWLDAHPHRDNDEAAIFGDSNTKFTTGNSKRDQNDKDPTDPVRYNTLRQALNRRAKDAGIEKDVYPHLMRHCAITRMVLEGQSEQQIKHTVNFDKDSSQFEIYVSLADELANDAVRKQLNLPTASDIDPAYRIGRPSFEKCLECGEELPTETERCPFCKVSLTHADYIERDDEPQADPLKSGIEQKVRKKLSVDPDDSDAELLIDRISAGVSHSIHEALNDFESRLDTMTEEKRERMRKTTEELDELTAEAED